jgi:hypothetical protein
MDGDAEIGREEFFEFIRPLENVEAAIPIVTTFDDPYFH